MASGSCEYAGPYSAVTVSCAAAAVALVTSPTEPTAETSAFAVMTAWTAGTDCAGAPAAAATERSSTMFARIAAMADAVSGGTAHVGPAYPCVHTQPAVHATLSPGHPKKRWQVPWPEQAKAAPTVHGAGAGSPTLWFSTDAAPRTTAGDHGRAEASKRCCTQSTTESSTTKGGTTSTGTYEAKSAPKYDTVVDPNASATYTTAYHTDAGAVGRGNVALNSVGDGDHFAESIALDGAPGVAAYPNKYRSGKSTSASFQRSAVRVNSVSTATPLAGETCKAPPVGGMFSVTG